MELTKKAKLIILGIAIVFAASYFYINRAYFLPKPKPVQHIGIVSLSPIATEILVSLGVQNVVGISNNSEFPERTKIIKRMGTSLSPSVEEIIAAAPEIIFVEATTPQTAIDAISKSGVRVITIPEARSVEDVYFNINFIASNANQNSAQLIEELKAGSGGREKAKAKVFVDLDGSLLTIGYANFINDVLAYSGLKNVFGNIGEDTFKVSWENVIAQNPDLIISIGSNTADYSAMPGAQNVNAVKNHRVYTLPDITVLSTQSPRVIKTIAYLKGLADDTQQPA